MFERRRTIIWLNGIGLTIEDASFRPQAAAALPAKTVPGGDQFIGFSFDQPISGKGTIHVVYQGKISRNSSAGIFQLKEDRDWYVYSQFEPTDARRAFPCFDEPGFKVPWQMTLHVPKDDMALSNTPVQSESSEPNGMKVVRFKTSPPLPSYLVALAVGRFDAVNAGHAGATPRASDCSSRQERGSRLRRHRDTAIAEIAGGLFRDSVPIREAGFGSHAHQRFRHGECGFDHLRREHAAREPGA